jgi:hypothetical protein
MDHAVVWEIRYVPSVEEERAHQDRLVTVVAVGVDANGMDEDHPCQVTWRVVGVTDPSAMPYGCEWRLDNYVVQGCSPPGEHGERDDDGQLLGLAAR